MDEVIDACKSSGGVVWRLRREVRRWLLSGRITAPFSHRRDGVDKECAVEVQR